MVRAKVKSNGERRKTSRLRSQSSIYDSSMEEDEEEEDDVQDVPSVHSFLSSVRRHKASNVSRSHSFSSFMGAVGTDLFHSAPPYFNPVGSLKRLQKVIEMAEMMGNDDDQVVDLDQMASGNVRYMGFSKEVRVKVDELVEQKRPEETFKLEESVSKVVASVEKGAEVKVEDDDDVQFVAVVKIERVSPPSRKTRASKRQQPSEPSSPTPIRNLSTAEPSPKRKRQKVDKNMCKIVMMPPLESCQVAHPKGVPYSHPTFHIRREDSSKILQPLSKVGSRGNYPDTFFIPTAKKSKLWKDKEKARCGRRQPYIFLR